MGQQWIETAKYESYDKEDEEAGNKISA